MGKGLLKAGKTFLKDASPIFSGTQRLIYAFLAPLQCIFHTFPCFLAAPSARCSVLIPGVGGLTDPPVTTTLHLSGPSQCSLPEGFLQFQFLFAACCNKYPKTGFYCLNMLCVGACVAAHGGGLWVIHPPFSLPSDEGRLRLCHQLLSPMSPSSAL